MRHPGLAVGIGVLFAAALGCAVGGEQTPGCHIDADCGEGWTCTEGACFRTTTGLSPPPSGGDAGDAGDAGD